MNGLIFMALEKYVEETSEPNVWEEVIVENDWDGIIIGSNVYADELLYNLVESIGNKKNKTSEVVLYELGVFTLPVLMKYCGEYVTYYKSSADLITDLDTLIHNEISKIFSNVTPPQIELIKGDDNIYELIYKSDRKLNTLLEGLLEALAEVMNESLTILSKDTSSDNSKYTLKYESV